MKKCKKVMTRNTLCCLPDDLVIKAAELMKSGNVGSIPVVDNEQTQNLVGIVTDRDLALKVIAMGLDPNSTIVDLVMTRKVVTCRAGADLKKALEAMTENQLRRIPVVNRSNKLLGIISQADVATRSNHPRKTAAMVKGISRSIAN
ncbi:MAG: CBS domain-containing protein [Chloroflexi bacterium]|nr:CBS domain-containing protein [Chloroflexota bacterium]